MSKKNNYEQAIHILKELHKDFPTYNLGRHLATALDEYGDLWGLEDKELVFALEKYKMELNMDVPHVDDKEIDKIIKDAMDLDNILKEEDDDGDF